MSNLTFWYDLQETCLEDSARQHTIKAKCALSIINTVGGQNREEWIWGWQKRVFLEKQKLQLTLEGWVELERCGVILYSECRVENS